MFHTNEALREAVELEPCPYLFDVENAFNNEDEDDNDPVTARWSTTFTWNMTRPPPSMGGDFATTLFVAVYGDTVDDAEVSGEGEDRGVDGGDDTKLLWALGVATRVSFRLGGRLNWGGKIELTCTVCVGMCVHVFDYRNDEDCSVHRGCLVLEATYQSNDVASARLLLMSYPVRSSTKVSLLLRSAGVLHSRGRGSCCCPPSLAWTDVFPSHVFQLLRRRYVSKGQGTVPNHLEQRR